MASSTGTRLLGRFVAFATCTNFYLRALVSTHELGEAQTVTKARSPATDPNDEIVFNEIVASVQELARRNGVTKDRAFAAWYALTFLDIDEDDALEAAAIDGGEDQGIDFLIVDDSNERVILIQAYLPESHTKVPPRKKLDALLASISLLHSPEVFEKAGRSDLANIVEEVKKAIDDGYEALGALVTLGADSDQITRILPTHNDSGRYAPFTLSYESFPSIRPNYDALKSSAEGGVAEDTIRFADDKFFEESGDFGKAYVGSLKAVDVASLFDRHGDRLFARNVRQYLGTRKGSINEQIVATAKSEPGQFWALNNGISIVADTIRKTDDGFRITRFSIVNGCQTTVSLSRASADAKARVLARLVAAKPAVVSNIVRYNNTQNAVKIWTVRAADNTQKKISRALKDVGIDYAPKPSTSKRKPLGTITIQLDRLAQYLASIHGLVVEAVKEKSELFDRHYQTIFPVDIKVEQVLLAWLLGSQADESRQNRLEALKESDADESTAFLSVAGTYWIAFCAYKLVRGFNSSLRLDLNAMTTAEFQAALRKYTDEALDLFFEISGDTYEPEAHGSPRQAMRSAKFLARITSKIDNKIASMKKKKRKMPDLESASKSAKRK